MAAFKTIGVLGGMGPEATILLQRKLVEAVPANDDCDHIPLLIDMNPQVPSRIAHLIERTGEDPGPTLGLMARGLQSAGATALAMPCNTAHHYADAITEATEIPLLNMMRLAAAHAAKSVSRGVPVGMLASPALRKAQVFEAAVRAFGIEVVWPANDDKMLSAIKSIKANGPTPFARTILLEASHELADIGAGIHFVACSEFSIISDSVAPGMVSVDTLDLLIDAMVSFATG
ncbi:MAG: aspartate/glutamate racemase family protein [Planktomarina sp.]